MKLTDVFEMFKYFDTDQLRVALILTVIVLGLAVTGGNLG